MEYSIKEITKLFKNVQSATVRGWIRNDLQDVKDNKEFVLSRPNNKDPKKPWILTEKAVEIIKNKHISKFIDIEDTNKSEDKTNLKTEEDYKIIALKSKINMLEKNNEDLRGMVIDLRNQRDMAQQANLKLMKKLPDTIDNKIYSEKQNKNYKNEYNELLTELEKLNSSFWKRMIYKKRINEILAMLKKKQK